MKVLRRRLTWYRLLDSGRHDDVDGEIEDERAALQRAARLADFYRHPLRVVRWSMVVWVARSLPQSRQCRQRGWIGN
jgi:hypothetical protein